MLYHIPIEPYETRYTADWIGQFETNFKKNKAPFKTILGTPTTTEIKDGSVLDACGTHIYKFSQLLQIIKMIERGKVKDGDVFFFNDLWFPGIESLFYIRNITEIDFKIVGILHAGTYDPADFTSRTGMRPWGKHIELGWLTGVDKIFLATEYHKELLLQGAETSEEHKAEICNKIKVTGIPFYANDFIPATEKENIVVFPHRPDEEKHPELFDEFSKYEEVKDYRFIKTMETTKDRDEYFDLLAKSKIMLSFADQETFGYSTMEAMALGNVVIVPNKLSYVETVPAEFRYDTLEEARILLNKAVKGQLKPHYPEIGKWTMAIDNMYTEIKKEGWNV